MQPPPAPIAAPKAFSGVTTAATADRGRLQLPTDATVADRRETQPPPALMAAPPMAAPKAFPGVTTDARRRLQLPTNATVADRREMQPPPASMAAPGVTTRQTLS